MLKAIFGRVSNVAMKTMGALREPLKRLGQIGYNVGKFAIQNHATIAPLLHGVAVLSGNENAQKITGGLLSVSKMATLRQNLNADNQKIKTEMGKGQSGVWDHAKGGFR